jgi:hypothetical protein
VHSTNNGMHIIDSHEVLQGPSVELVPMPWISLEFLHGPHPTAANVTSSSVGVLAVHGRPAFTCAAGVTLSVSQRSCSKIVETH